MNYNRFKNFITSPETLSIIVAATALGLCWLIGYLTGANDATFITAGMGAVAGVAGAGTHVEGEPLTTAVVDTEAPSLLRNEIDSRIVKIRPMSTPLDQISRYGGSRQCRSMKVDYYSVDTKPVTTTLTAANPAPDDRTVSDDTPVTLKVAEARVFQRSTTVLVPSVKASSGEPLVLYVADNNDGLKVLAVNNVTADGHHVVPAIAKGATLVRMGRAAAELDVTTPMFEALPKKATNYCQIFKAQVEQSTFVKIANKEAGWSFSDQEEAAIIDMRMGMEKNFLMGHCTRIRIPDSEEEVMLTGGVWNQTDNDLHYTAITSEADLVGLCKQAFAHNAGSTRKILLAGSDLIEALHKIDHTRVIASEKAVTKWGLDFTEIHSKFGTLYVLLSEVFDQCGMPGNGMVIDPEYITKYTHVPMRTERLDLRAAGVRNVDAIVITEASCLVLRYPKTHMRIIKD